LAGLFKVRRRQGRLGMFPRAGLDRRILAGLAFAGFSEVFLILLFLYGALPLRCQAGIAFIALVMSHEFAPRLEYWSYRAQQIAGPASTGCGAASFWPAGAEVVQERQLLMHGRLVPGCSTLYGSFNEIR